MHRQTVRQKRWQKSWVRELHSKAICTLSYNDDTVKDVIEAVDDAEDDNDDCDDIHTRTYIYIFIYNHVIAR